MALGPRITGAAAEAAIVMLAACEKEETGELEQVCVMRVCVCEMRVCVCVCVHVFLCVFHCGIEFNLFHSHRCQSRGR